MWRIHNAESMPADGKPGQFDNPPIKNIAGGPHTSWIRYPVNLEATCYALDPRKPPLWTTQVRMLWLAGCCLLSPEPLVPGDEFWCRLRSGGRLLTHMLRLQVIQVTQDEQDGWFATCAFAHILTHNDCSILL